MSAHTPGPWMVGATDMPRTFNDGWVDSGGFRIDADGIEQLCYVWNASNRVPSDGSPQETGPRFGDDRGAANARLIAAAPDLLAVVTTAVDMLEEPLLRDVFGQVWVDAAKSAIAKAKGESHG